MTMIERVAEALRGVYPKGDYELMARAVVQTMYRPSVQMTSAGWHQCDAGTAPDQVWIAMIDAALTEGA